MVTFSQTCFGLLQSLSHVPLFATPWTATRQATLPFTIPRVCSNSCPLSRWCHSTISSSVVPFSSCLQSFSAPGSFPMSHLLVSGGQSMGSSTSASVLPMSIQDWFPLGLTVWLPCWPRHSQESSPAPQIEDINSLVLSFFYCPALTSRHDFWRNHSSEYMNLCRQSNVSAF